jgi:hypothetical protein
MWEALLQMRPHDFADCLAGAFGPVAFLWLVLGFFQQGEELRHSSTALYLQGEELRNSVEQQRQLVEVSRRQVESEMEQRRVSELADHVRAQPVLALEHGNSMHSDGLVSSEYWLTSGGPTCSSLKVSWDTHAVTRSIFAAGDKSRVILDYNQGDELEDKLVRVEYTDARSRPQDASFIIPVIRDTQSDRYGTPLKAGPERPPAP